MTELKCDYLLFVATLTERDELMKAALDMGLTWSPGTTDVGEFWNLGEVGSSRVVAVRTRVGSIGPSGSARNAHHYVALTQVRGGEMEGAGFLSLAERRRPSWIVVKAISDYADEHQGKDVEVHRPQACANAARFVLQALNEWKPPTSEVQKVMALDELFANETEPTPPPETRRWEALARGRRMACEFLRRRDGLSWGPARIQVTFPDTDLPPEQTVLWDLAIDDWLLAHHVRAITPKNEAERFGYRLDALFEPIEDRYGDGYFNSVLITYLKGSDFANRPNLGKKLHAVSEYPRYQSQAAADCLERITQVLAATARTLISLYTDRAQAETILCDAIAYYLDDRFNISTRVALGWA